ncbi:hypothetical protein LMG10661_02432 [Ralstonia syzygii subsp. syzygii]|nr:hypothetical protein LMG10661_02432 [Ralstonia syzygii subsp. syzygii]
MILSINYLYWLAGIVLTITALMTFADKTHPRRWTTGLFWAIFAVIFLVGDKLPPILVGLGAVLMAVLAGFGGVVLGKHGELPIEERRASAKRLGNRLFIPALTIPVVTVIGSVLLKDVKIGGDFLLDPKNQTFVSLGIGCIVALGLACWLTRDTPVQAMRESRRLTESLGWALVLPQMLAMLGLVFADAGVGKAVAHLTTAYINMDYRLVAVIVYCVGVPILVGVYHANPAVMAAIGMFSGYCGTLMTPMAANFNIVPAALLELSDKNAVIKAQVPTALLLLTANIVLLYVLMLR